jgi:membrane-associated phospholipid phosphatase
VAQSLNAQTNAGSQVHYSLPLFLTRQNKYISVVLMLAFAGGVYLLSNHFPLTTPRYLPMSWIDQAIPLVPWTVWIYISETFLFFTAYFLFKDMTNANKYIYSFLGLQLVSVAIFWFWPTTYPRAEYPLPSDLDALTFYVFNGLRNLDSPGNCCPSLHVSSCYLTSFIFLDEQKEKFPIFFCWATAVAVTTLTTKQHYIIDIATGFLMAVIFYYIFHRFVSYRPIRAGLQPNR